MDVVAILDQRKRDHLDQALADIQTVLPRLDPPYYLDAEADWSKIKSIEFRESINARNKLLEEQNQLALDLDDEFFDVVSGIFMHWIDRSYGSTVSSCACGRPVTHKASKVREIEGIPVLAHLFCSLRLSLSDQNLELLPDYEQRIAVLQELQFIDENCTVLLKGRVACEVSSALVHVVYPDIPLDQFGQRSHLDGAHSRECFVSLRARRGGWHAFSARLPREERCNSVLDSQTSRSKRMTIGLAISDTTFQGLGCDEEHCRADLSHSDGEACRHARRRTEQSPSHRSSRSSVRMGSWNGTATIHVLGSILTVYTGLRTNHRLNRCTRRNDCASYH